MFIGRKLFSKILKREMENSTIPERKEFLAKSRDKK